MERSSVPEHSSLNGFNRKPQWKGYPLVPSVIVFSFFLMLGGICMFVFGPLGALVSGLMLPVLIFMKQITETDDDAIRVLVFEAYCFCMRRNTASFGRTLTLAPIKYGRHLDVYRRPFA